MAINDILTPSEAEVLSKQELDQIDLIVIDITRFIKNAYEDADPQYPVLVEYEFSKSVGKRVRRYVIEKFADANWTVDENSGPASLGCPKLYSITLRDSKYRLEE